MTFSFSFSAFLSSPPEEFESIMTSLEKVFTQKTGANAPEDVYGLQTAALSAWTLLFSLLPSNRAYNSLESHMELFENLFDAPNVELRIATGEAVVVLYENAYDHDEDGAHDIVDLVSFTHFPVKLQFYKKSAVCLQFSFHFSDRS